MSISRKMTPKNADGILRVLIIGRVSTEHQSQSNIEAGYEYAERILKDVFDGKMEIRRLGEQGSGMLVNRRTILEACALIDADWPDLVLMEDLSKAYRNPGCIYKFVQDCYDHNIRVIAPGDRVDTYDEEWEVALNTAASRHGMHIPDTRRRVRRTAIYSFERGGMVTKVRFGYRKLTKEDAASGKFGPKDLRMAKVSELTSIFDQLRQQVVVERHGGQALANWLNETRVPLPQNVQSSTQWTAKMVLDLLRDPILCGYRQFPKVIFQVRFKDGNYTRVRNTNPTRIHYPELAHMSEEQFNEMNAILNDLRGNSGRQRGRDNPRYRVRRKDSIVPFQHMTCAVCGRFFYEAGRAVMKCRHSLNRYGGTCWNHVQVSCVRSREALVDLMIQRLDRHPDARNSLAEAAWEQIENARRRSGYGIEMIDREIAELKRRSKHLAEAISKGGRLEVLVEQLQLIDKALKVAQKKRKAAEVAVPEDNLPQTREAMAIDLRQALLHLAATSFEFADLMRKIIPVFNIQPIQQLDSGQVRPRAILKLDLGALYVKDRPVTAPVVEELSIDMFDPPVHIQHLKAVVDLKAMRIAQGLKASLTILAEELKIGRMTVKRALAYQRLMANAGLTEPYRVLTAAPAAASRWKPCANRRKRVA